jgi:hypothetical protein
VGKRRSSSFLQGKEEGQESMSERINRVTGVVVLTAGLFLTGWFYYELYQVFCSPYPAF